MEGIKFMCGVELKKKCVQNNNELKSSDPIFFICTFGCPNLGSKQEPLDLKSTFY